MVTMKERPGDWKVTGIIKRDHRHDKSDGYEETPHRKTKVHKAKRHEGCPGNDNGPHVYVWTKETAWRPSFWRYDNWFWYFSDYEYRTCAGCYKHKTWRRRKGVR